MDSKSSAGFLVRLSYFFYRCLARLVGSIFFPMFRVWGEFGCKARANRIWVGKDRGFLSWISVLRVFSSPVAYITARPAVSRWARAAMAGGIEFISLSYELEKDMEMIIRMLGSREVVVLLDNQPDSYQQQLLLQLQKAPGFLFFAVSGLEGAVKPGAIIPSVCQINVFGGLPVVNSAVIESPFEELEILERTIRSVPLGELPSIFFNHQRNQQTPG